MKTIKQIADEIGVSKQAVYKKIKQEPLSTNLQGLMLTVDGRLTVSVDGENAIKIAFNTQMQSTKFTGGVNQSVNEVDTTVNLIDEKNTTSPGFDGSHWSTKFTGGVNQDDKVDNETESQTSNIIKLLQENIAVLQAQLQVKDAQLESKDRQVDELATAVRLHAEGVSTDRKNELVETLIDNKKILIDGDVQKTRWWQFWKRL